MSTPKFNLKEIVAYQKATTLCIQSVADPHDLRGLALTQRLYAAKMAQMETLDFLHGGGPIEITVSGQFTALTFHIDEGTAENIFEVLRTPLYQDLRDLESRIVRMRKRIEQEMQDDATEHLNDSNHAEDVEYARAIVSLCTQPIAVPSIYPSSFSNSITSIASVG